MSIRLVSLNDSGRGWSIEKSLAAEMCKSAASPVPMVAGRGRTAPSSGVRQALEQGRQQECVRPRAPRYKCASSRTTVRHPAEPRRLQSWGGSAVFGSSNSYHHVRRGEEGGGFNFVPSARGGGLLRVASGSRRTAGRHRVGHCDLPAFRVSGQRPVGMALKPAVRAVHLVIDSRVIIG